MQGCLLLSLLLLCSPRVAAIIIAIFTNWFSLAYSTVIWPILGWFFAPLTTLAYMWASIQTGGNITFGWGLMIAFAVLVDIGAASASANAKKE